jgi:hypothetical protein
VIEKHDFDPKMQQLKVKLQQIDHQIAASKEHAAGQCELFLVINRLEEFAAAVNDRLSAIDFTTKREIIRALVKRIEIHKDEIVVVFRVDPDPGLQSGDGSANSKGGQSIMQDRTRRIKPGLRELIVGRGAQAQFRGATPGSVIRLNNQDWWVVGVFSSGDAHESELWGDAESVGAAYRRNGFQSVTARLVQPQVIERLAAALTHDPRLRVDVQTTRAYYGKQSQRLTQVIRGVGTVVVVIMALGAVFGALNTTYAAVAGRSLEIATLRALGFTAVPVVLAVMLETMALALAGGLLGAGVAWAAFNGYQVSTLGSNFSQVVFQFDVTPALLLQGVQWAVGIGFVGGFFPAVRAASLPVIHALRAQ